MKVRVLGALLAALASFAGVCDLQPAHAALVFSEDFQAGTVGNTVDTLPGWSAVGDGGTQVIASSGSNLFATTGNTNNSASRYDFAIANPGFGPGTVLVMTIDVLDPTTNPAGVSTFPRAVGGILQTSGGAFMPPYFGIEHNDATADTGIAEWTVTGEDFANQQFGPADTLAQDTWFTMRAVWDLDAETMDVFAKTRDGADPFVQVFDDAATPFTSGSQDLSALNVWRHRLNRGTAIDNIRVEAVPEPTSHMLLAIVVMGTGLIGLRPSVSKRSFK